MPEVMLLLCNDDKAVVPDNSIAFYRALNRRGVKAEMHIYPEGSHGFWMQRTLTSTATKPIRPSSGGSNGTERTTD